MGKEMSKILPGLFVGRLDNAQNDVDIMANCITHVLSVHEPVKQKLQKSNSFQYFDVNVKDEETAIISKYFPKTNDFIHEARCKNGNVLIHCLAGVSRAPTIVLAYLMTVYSLTFHDAYNCLKAARPNMKPNVGFLRQLEEFENNEVEEERARLFKEFGVWENIEEDKKLLMDLKVQFENRATDRFYIENSVESNSSIELSNKISNSMNLVGNNDNTSDIMNSRAFLMSSSASYDENILLDENEDIENELIDDLGHDDLSPNNSSHENEVSDEDDIDNDEVVEEEEEEEEQHSDFGDEIPGSITIATNSNLEQFSNQKHSSSDFFDISPHSEFYFRPRANTQRSTRRPQKPQQQESQIDNNIPLNKKSAAVDIRSGNSISNSTRNNLYGSTAPASMAPFIYSNSTLD